MIWPTCLASADEMTGLSGGWIVAFGVPVLPGDAGELPFAFVATTVTVYVRPLTRFFTVHVCSPVVVQLSVPSAVVAYTVYAVMRDPLLLGAAQLTSSAPSSSFTVGTPGRSGTPESVTEFDVAPSDSPEAFTAVTVNV